MKISKAVVPVILGLVLVASAAWIYYLHARPEPEQAFRANLINAQKVLVTLRRSEAAYQQGANSYKYISAKKNAQGMIYSAGWSAMKLPEVEINTGFDFDCLPAEGVCRAIDTEKTGLTGNGIQIDIETGAYTCLGSYKPVTTEGFDGARVTVACQA